MGKRRSWHVVQTSTLNGRRKLTARPSRRLAEAQLRKWVQEYRLTSAPELRPQIHRSGHCVAAVYPNGRVPVAWHVEQCQLEQCTACAAVVRS